MKRLRWPALAMAGVAAVVALFLALPSPRHPPRLNANVSHPTLVALGLAAAPSEPVTLVLPSSHQHLERVRASDANVLVYRVVSNPAPRKP
jgi:hypothetical protein